MTVIHTGLASTVPVSMAPGANGNVYMVNGLTRGRVIVSGTTAYPLGVTKAPAVTASSTNSPQYYFVSSVEVLNGGENYRYAPSVTISGVSGAKAELFGDSLYTVTITTSATTHTGAPSVDIDHSAQARNATAAAILRGQVASVKISGDAFFTRPPKILFSNSTSITATRGAAAQGVLTYSTLAATSGVLRSAVISDPGIYAWNGSSITALSQVLTASVTQTTAAGWVSGSPSITIDMSAVVSSVTVVSGGTDYAVAPNVSFTPAGPTRRGDGALAIADLAGKTSVDSITLAGGGNGYEGRVEVSLDSDKAVASATLTPRLFGKFLCGVRYIDTFGNVGDLCDLFTVNCGDRASSIRWNVGAATAVDGTPNRIAAVELWRTSSDQAITLYKVVTLTAAQIVSASGVYTDGLPDFLLTDPDRTGYDELPILTSDGFANAQRFGIPPANMSVVTLFQDRAWYAVDSTAANPNTIYFSGIGELESVPSENQLVIENIGRDSDSITGLMPMDGVLFIGQRKNLIRLATGGNPLQNASAVPAAQRGMLNDRCWDQFEGVAYIADSTGVYAFSGSSAEPISDAIHTFWSEPEIDFSKSKWFFLRVSRKERVVRFYFCHTGSESEYPTSALCYSTVTKAWWVESYGKAISCGVRSTMGGQQEELLGSAGQLYSQSGATDDGTAIGYCIKTGNFPLNTDPKRGIRLLYSPTDDTHVLQMRMYYNNESSPRANAIASDRGTGVVTTTGSTEATLDLSSSRTTLGSANGFAQMSFAGRLDDRSAGGDRHLAIELAGDQYDTKPVIHSVSVEGVG